MYNKAKAGLRFFVLIDISRLRIGGEVEPYLSNWKNVILRSWEKRKDFFGAEKCFDVYIVHQNLILLPSHIHPARWMLKATKQVHI